MGKTDLTKRGVHESRLSDKQRRFVAEYCVDYNGTQAALRAGYAESSAQVTASKLLKQDIVMRAIAQHERKTLEYLGIKKEDVLTQLLYCVMRNGREYVDDEGIILPINKLSIRAAAAIDGIEQDVETWTDRDGEEHTRVKTKYRLVGKASAIDMAMKHQGQYATQEVNHTGEVKLNWDDMFNAVQSQGKTIDVTEYRISNPQEEPPAPELNHKEMVNELIEDIEDE